MSLSTGNESEDLQLLPDGKVLISSVSNVQSDFVDVNYSLFIEQINYQCGSTCNNDWKKVPTQT